MIRHLLAFALITASPSLFARTVTMTVDGTQYSCSTSTPNISGVSAQIFGEILGCDQGGTGSSRISNRCECIDDNGPDLIQIGFTNPPYSEQWRTKIQGWNNVTGAWEQCWTSLRNTASCQVTRDVSIGRRCECVDDNGPDLMQIGFDTQSGSQVWKTKIGGWNNVTGSWQQCWAAIQSEPACR